MSVSEVIDTVQIIDVDTHVTEPPDLWTSRMSSAKWGDKIPYVKWDDRWKEERWYVGDTSFIGVGTGAMAGWNEYVPSQPPRMDDTDPGSWDPNARLKRMDEYGIYGQLIYPNILGFHWHAFLALKDREFMLECVKVYNDFLVDFCSADPKRLYPLMVLPFWDVDACLAEMERCAARGHRGIVFAQNFEKVGEPALSSGHWDRIFDRAQGMQLPVNFHVGFGAWGSLEDFEHTLSNQSTFDRRTHARDFALFMIGNARGIAEVIMNGVCEKFPRLDFVSIESGFGFLPYFLQALDWQWHNDGIALDNPGVPLPSEMFKRQVYGTFWFEQIVPEHVAPWVDNLMFETDYPHPTSLSPGPASSAAIPSVAVKQSLAGLPDDAVRKIVHGNAARVYHLDETR
jgi:predicted TIM-barrel fold metal-dependent hydrolase